MPSASSDPAPFPDLVLRQEQRANLAKPMGPVLSASDARAALEDASMVATCGDVVTQSLLEWGVHPYAAVVDFKTQRSTSIEADEFDELTKIRPARHAKNPAGTLTGELQTQVRELIRHGGGLLIVDGEEDLAVLPLVRELPVGSTLIYGQPGAGLCFLAVDATVKSSVQRILDGMEARPSDHGH